MLFGENPAEGRPECLLGLIVEASPEAAVSALEAPFRKVVEAVLSLGSAFQVCERFGELVILGALPGRSEVLHASRGGLRPSFAEVREAVASKLADAAAADAAVVGELPRCATARALGRFLCLAKKRGVAARAVVLKLDDDVPEQYNAIMNCIFSAQRHDVVVDACVLSPQTSVFMKQAVHLTKGVFLHLANKAGQPDFVVDLLAVFAPSPQCRRDHLRTPLLEETDFRAACFCHDPPQVKHTGFVCSVCFAVYCDPHHRCSCSTPKEQRHHIIHAR